MKPNPSHAPPAGEPSPEVSVQPRSSPQALSGAANPARSRPTSLRRLLGRPVSAVSIILLVLLLVTAVLADVIGWRDPTQQFRSMEMAPPMTMAPDGALLLLGGDELGRDLFSRLVHGARISLFVSLGATLGAALIGAVLGLIAGYYGGLIDALLLRIVDIFMSMPVVILAMVIATVLNAGIVGVVLAIIIIYWPRVARVVRADTLLVKELDYVLAARAVGSSDFYLIWRHILPNVSSSMIILATTTMGAAILIEASLAFLAVGAVPPTPSWGLMIADARAFLTRDPKLLIVPGTALTLVVLAFNLGGDVLRDRLDPRMRGLR